jgi:hypothetical protein
MKPEPRIKPLPDNAPPGSGWDLLAANCEANGWTERALKAREMAERSRKAGRDLRADELVMVEAKGQLSLWELVK